MLVNILEQPLPVYVGHEVGLHVVHYPALPALVHGEGLQGLSAVVELSQNHRAVAGHQRAGCVAVILGGINRHQHNQIGLLMSDLSDTFIQTNLVNSDRRGNRGENLWEIKSKF